MIYSVRSISDNEDGGKGFVGVSNTKTDEKRVIVVPYGYDRPGDVSSLDKPRVEQLRRYVKSVQKALKEHTREGLDYTKGLDNPFAAINIIHDYLSMGRFIEHESYRAASNRGKINFKQTVKRIRPKVVGDRFFYDTFITERKRTVENSLVATVQGNVINDFMANGGDILFGQSLKIPIDPIKLKNAKLLQLLRSERNASFNSRKLNLINWEMEYIQSLLNPNYETRGEWNYAIIAYYFWETVVDSIYGNIDKDKTLYGTIYKSFDIKTGKVDSGNSTEHDTIYEDDDSIYIIDSKMYASQHNLLSEDVLGKQFGYYLSAKEKQPAKTIVNILFLPWISGKKGFQYNVIEDPYNKPPGDPDKIIFTYACPVNDLIDDYYYGKKRIGQLKEEFAAFIAEPAVRAYLNSRGTSY